jgi:tRNA pseudouridine38-40 synthase
MQPVLEKNRVWWVGPHLDEQKMNDAAKLLLGKHDFSTFRAAECQAKSPVKTLDEAYFVREGEHIYFYTSATSFLHHQVRNMVGALKLVGEGKWSIADFKKAFDACDRTKGGPNASPSGLYFMRVEY